MSYTEELTQQVVNDYLSNPTRENVDAIATRIAKSSRSVIAKLAAAGVYKTPERTTKTGEPIVKKEELAADINSWLNIDTETLVKTGKQDLIRLHRAIKELVDERQD